MTKQNDILKKGESVFTNPLILIIVALLCCALWGSATPFIKLGYELMLPERNVASTLLFAGIRFFLAGVITVLIYSIASKKFLFPKKENTGKIITVSLFQTILQYMFFYIGLANTTGVKGTILSGSSTFFAIIIAGLIFRQEKLTLKKIIACVLGFLGMVFVNLNGLDLNMNFTGDAFVLFSAIASGVSAVLLKKYSSYEEPFIISGYQFAFGGLVMILTGVLLGGEVNISDFSSVCVILYLALLSAVAYSLWGVLLKYNPVSKVTVFSFTIPIFGVFLTKLILTEPSGVSALNIIISLALVCAGISVSNLSGIKRKED